MRVLLIDVNCKGSSTGKIVYDLYSYLNSCGNEASICYGRGALVDEPHIFKFGLDFETRIHALLTRITGYNACFSFFSTQRLIKYIDDYKPDLIHIHELHAYFVNIGKLIKHIKEKHIPVVWTFHCEYMYTGKCGYAYDCEKWKTGCGHCQAIQEYPKSLLFDQTKSMFKMKKQLLDDFDFTIVTPSRWLADRTKQSFLKTKDIYVIHNGIDTDNVFYPRNNSEKEALRNKYHINDRKIVLSVAPNIMEERKGGKKVIEIANKMPEYQFVLVGSDQNIEYSNNVLMIKRTTNQDELATWYSMASVFLICSNKENFPTTCLEAFSCGTPVVGIDEGGTKETVPEPYGIFVSDNSYGELIKGIEAHIHANHSVEDVRNLSAQLYSKQVMCEKYVELYKKKMK